MLHNFTVQNLILFPTLLSQVADAAHILYRTRLEVLKAEIMSLDLASSLLS